MKLLVIFPSTQRGGVEEYSLKIASAAFHEKWEVHAAFPETDGTTSLIKDFTEKEIIYHPLEIAEISIPSWEEIIEKTQGILSMFPSLIVPRLQFDSSKLPHFCRSLLLLLKIKPEVVMINLPWSDYGMGSILACGFLKIPTIVVFHLIPNPISVSNIKLKLYTWARKRNQKWLGICQSNCQFISESFKIPVDELRCIYNGAKPFTYNRPENLTDFRTQVRQELGLSATTKIALTVARLSSQKGYDYLIPTIPHLCKEFPELKFVWVGDGEKREILVNLVKEYGVSDRVLFLGHRSDVPRLLQAADLFVFPTHYEGQPFAVLEAMGYGLPVIASATNGIPEVIENHVHGLLTRTGDSCDLLEAIRWALRNPEAMEAMAKKSQLRVQDFSEEKMIQETLALLDTMVSRNQ
jgi:glycosyltransferase involved in cell wall biosynthesis